MEINKEEHKYENLAKEIDHAFYKNCSDCKNVNTVICLIAELYLY